MKLQSNYYLLIIALLFSILIVLSCSMGGTSEQGNAKVSGIVYGIPLKDTIVNVHLVAQGYNPFSDDSTKVYSTTTDSTGNYELDSVKPGTYYLYAFSVDNKQVLLDGPFTVSENGDEHFSGSLAHASVISIVDSDILHDSSSFYFIEGTSKSLVTKDTLVYRMTVQGVPSGVHDVMKCIFADSAPVETQLYSEAVAILPGDSLAVSRSNRPPRIIDGSQTLPSTVYFDSTYTLSIKALDPDSDTVVYSIEPELYNCVIDTSNGTLSWTPAQRELPITGIVIKAKDHHGAFTLFKWDFEVKGAGAAPVPATPSGVSSIPLDTTASFTGNKCECINAATRYRFSWGDGDTSIWSETSSASHAWKLPGTYPVRIQTSCVDFPDSSPWSDALSVSVYKDRITQTPKLLITIDTVTLHDTLHDVAFDPKTNTVVNSPGSYIVNDTIQLTVQTQPCSSTVLYNYYVNDSSFTGWTSQSEVTFRPQYDGIHEFKVMSWCDSVRTLQSGLSAPCTVVVKPEKLAKPAIYGITTLKSGQPLILKLDVSGDTVFNGVPVYYRYNLFSKGFSEKDTVTMGQMIVSPCNTGSSCQDTIVLKATGPTYSCKTNLYRGQYFTLSLVQPQIITYGFDFSIQAQTVDGKHLSDWVYYTIKIE
jgi:hypothetical protein